MKTNLLPMAVAIATIAAASSGKAEVTTPYMLPGPIEAIANGTDSSSVKLVLSQHFQRNVAIKHQPKVSLFTPQSFIGISETNG